MPKVKKSIVGIGMLAAGLAGLIYALPIISNAVAAKGLVFKESDVPATPTTLGPYIAIIIASAGLLIGGIFFSIMGQGNAEETTESSKQDTEKNAAEHTRDDTHAA